MDLKSILLGVVIGIGLGLNLSTEDEIKPVTVTLPEKSGSTGIVEVEKIVHDTVYLPSKKEFIQIDKGWKKKYELAKSENEKLKLYYESIKINKYEKTIVDNDTISIKGKFTTRGSLLDYNIDYKIHPTNLTYEPKVIRKHPKLMVGLGVEAGIPVIPTSRLLFKGNISFEDSKGNNFNLGYDTRSRVWLGYTKTFKIF